MNVFGQRERSWRKSRKRAVSPIIATILLVAITVVLAAVLYVLISGLTHGPGSTPIGSAFTAGNAITGTCSPAQVTAKECAAAGHYTYTLTIESSTVTFASVQFEVKNSGGTVVTTTTGQGFVILAIAGNPVAWGNVTGGVMAMTSALTTPSSFPTSTPLSTTYTILVDMGTASPSGQGYNFVTLGVGSYSGTTSYALP